MEKHKEIEDFGEDWVDFDLDMRNLFDKFPVEKNSALLDVWGTVDKDDFVLLKANIICKDPDLLSELLVRVLEDRPDLLHIMLVAIFTYVDEMANETKKDSIINIIKKATDTIHGQSISAN